MTSSFHKSLILLFFTGLVVSCADKDERNYQYFPDMYEGVGYETYLEYPVFQNGQEAKLPVEGTIPRGWMPYPYQDNMEGRTSAADSLKNPLPYTEDNLNEGKQLYTIYCAVCHGDNGDGKGILAQREKILGIPAYNDAGRNITEGSVYHAMYYGLNNMGSYASQTTIEERWKIDHYVMSLKDKLNGAPERAFEKNAKSNKESLLPSRAPVSKEKQDSLMVNNESANQE